MAVLSAVAKTPHKHDFLYGYANNIWGRRVAWLLFRKHFIISRVVIRTRNVIRDKATNYRH